MVFANSINSSNVHFQNTAGTTEIAERLRIATPGTTWNIGFSYGGDTFNILGSDGTALSATNPGYIVLQNRGTPGLNVLYTITANQSFIDDRGVSVIIGNLFGLTTGVAVTVDIPFYIYAVGNDAQDAISFMISRIPHRTNAPAVGLIGKTGSAVADSQGSCFALDNPTVADYDLNPCACIGAFRMKMSAADDWTVQGFTNADGIGQFQEGKDWTAPLGQFGAAAGSYFKTNGGTAPIWGAQVYSYRISRDGMIFATVRLTGNTTAAAGAVAAQMIIPVESGFSSLMGTYSSDANGGFSQRVGVNLLQFTNISVFASYQYGALAAQNFQAQLEYLADIG